MAAANGCWLAAHAGASHILLQSDCMAVIFAVRGTAKAARLVAIWDQLKELTIMSGVFISARHVKGHGKIVDARSWVNDWCDRHAYMEMEKLRGKYWRNPGKGYRQTGGGARRKKERAHPSGGVCPRP
jgi:hypothetical protein